MNGGNAALFPARVRSPARRRPILRSKSAAPKKKDAHVGVFLFWSGRRGSTRYRHPTNGRAIRRSPAGPLDSTRFAPVEAASSSLPAAFQKENTILTDGVSFCDYPQVLLFAPSHIARKGECEGETFAGSPTRVQSPARRRPLLRSKSAAPKKKDTHVGVFLFWSGRRGSNSLPRPWQGRALPDELRPQTAPLLQRLWCLRPGSNRRHADFQSAALPTELPRQIGDQEGARTLDLQRDRLAF